MGRKDRGITVIPAAASLPGFPALEGASGEIFEALQRGRNEHTVRSDLKSIEDFGRWLKAENFKELCKVFLFSSPRQDECLGNANRISAKYRAFLIDRKDAPNTIKRRLGSLKSVVKMARIFGFVPWELEILPVTSEAYRDTKGPGTDLFSDVFLALEKKKDDPQSARDLAILVLAHDAGLRRNEIATLDVEHVDFAQHRLWVKAKKRAEREEIPTSPEIEGVLRNWLRLRGDHPGPIFTNFDPAQKGSGRLDGSSVWRIVGKYGLGRTHGLRHLAITELAKVEKDIIKVMKFARHKDPKTTMIYIDNLKEASSEGSAKLAEIRRHRAEEKDGPGHVEKPGKGAK